MNEFRLPYREDIEVEAAHKFLDDFLNLNGEVNCVEFVFSVYEEGSRYGVRTTIEKQRYEVIDFE